jgi:hypothetical protein
VCPNIKRKESDKEEKIKKGKKDRDNKRRGDRMR